MRSRALDHDGDSYTAVAKLLHWLIAVLLLINVVLGVLARIAPQLNVFAVGFPLTLAAGMALLLLLLPYLESPLRSALERSVLVWR